jgi:hypothetical protein
MLQNMALSQVPPKQQQAMSLCIVLLFQRWSQNIPQLLVLSEDNKKENQTLFWSN